MISEFIFNAKINHLIDHPSIRTIDGVKMDVIGDNGVNISKRFGGHNLRESITNPFLLPGNIGVRYYDTTALTGGHLGATLLGGCCGTTPEHLATLRERLQASDSSA